MEENITLDAIVKGVSNKIEKAYLIKFRNQSYNFSIHVVHAISYDEAVKKLINKYPQAHKIDNWTIE